MYRLRDRDKLKLTGRGLKRLWGEKGSLFYIQKAHFHSAAPYFLHRLGRNDYIFDYDDYDVELSNLFARAFGTGCSSVRTDGTGLPRRWPGAPCAAWRPVMN
jgi:hypothetical protein